MKQFSQQLHKKATTTVKLQAAEQRELRERVMAYMEYHPLPAELKATASRQRAKEEHIPTEAFKTVRVPFHALFKYGAIAAAVVLVIVPILAERAMPGDTLYAIKVQFNEELRSTLTFDSYQKVEWETERLNRRIAEARLLASEGRLTEAVEAEVAAAVKEHTETAKREIEALRAEDADGAEIASIALDSTLEVQSTSLKGEEGGEVGIAAATRPISLIATAIDESRGQGMERASSTVPGYDKLMARVELNTTRIIELRVTLSEVALAEDLLEVDRRIADLERSIADAITLFETDELAARQILVDVLQRTQKLIVFMTEIQVRETVAIESLVPVVLTAEEKQSEMEQLQAALAEKIETIMTAVADVTDEAILEKVDVAIVSLEEQRAILVETLEYESYVQIAREALELANDTIMLLGYEGEAVEVTDGTVTDPDLGETSEEQVPTDEGGADAVEGSTTGSTDGSVGESTQDLPIEPEGVLDEAATGTDPSRPELPENSSAPEQIDTVL